MAIKGFNKEMDSYLVKRRTRYNRNDKKFKLQLNLDWLKGDEERVPEVKKGQVHVEYRRPTQWDKLFSFRRKIIKEANYDEDLSPQEMAKLRLMEDDVEETEQKLAKDDNRIRDLEREEEVLIEKRENLLSKLFSKLKFKRTSMNEEDVIMEEEYSQPVLDKDVVEAFKVAHKWIDQLTPAKKRSFKASNEFQIYKNALQKYGLIKKK